MILASEIPFLHLVAAVLLEKYLDVSKDVIQTPKPLLVILGWIKIVIKNMLVLYFM